MRYWVLGFFMLGCLALPFAGQTDQWHQYKNEPGNFSVVILGEPVEHVNNPANAASHTIQSVVNGVGYTVVYVLNATEQPVDEPTFKAYRDAFLKGLPQCNMSREEPASHPLDGYIGRWYRMNCDIAGKKTSFTGNLYWGKHYAYAVLTMFPSAPTDPPEASRFYNSFSVLDNSK